MSRAEDSPLLPAVLHGIELAGEPRALVRHRDSNGKQALPAATAAKEAGHPGQGDDPQPPPRPTMTAHDGGYQVGFMKGHQEGLEQGETQGLEMGIAKGKAESAQEILRQSQAAREAIALRIERLDQMLATLPTLFRDQITASLADSEDDMIALCHTVICRFLGDKLLSREAVVHAVRQAVEQCCGSGTHSALAGLMAIHVHANDLKLLREDDALLNWFQQNGAENPKDGVTWVPDEQVHLGGCVVHSDQGSLDARIETQLEALHDILMLGRTARVATAEGAPSPDSFRGPGRGKA